MYLDAWGRNRRRDPSGRLRRRPAAPRVHSPPNLHHFVMQCLLSPVAVLGCGSSVARVWLCEDPTWGIRGAKTQIRVFYSDVARFVNTVPLNMYACMS